MIDINFHGHNYYAYVKEFVDSSDPFITLEIEAQDVLKDYSQPLPEGGYKTFGKRVGAVTLYVRNVEDAERILEAAKQLLRSVHALEIEKMLNSI